LVLNKTDCYLDTFLYPCGRCNKTFAGYNKSSMQRDASVYYGFFNFYLGHGYAVDEPLHFMVDKSAPTEFMGFNYLIPEIDDVSNPTQNNAQDTLFAAEDDEEDRSNEESEELTETEFGDEHNVDVPLDDFLVSVGIDTTLQDAQIQQLNEEEILRQKDVEHRHFIHREIAKLLPETTGTKTTLEAFKRLTKNAAWIPFRLPGCDTQPTDVDCAEAQLFDEWKSHYKRVGGNPRNNYHAFARDWNIEAAHRLTMWSQGDEACVQISQIEVYCAA
jgi:hypothetical protein